VSGRHRSWFVVALVLQLLMLPTNVLGAAKSPGAVRVPHFVDETATAGVAHRYDGAFPYFTGGGVAVLDCDADGLPDLYLAGGEEPAGLYRNASAVGGALSFERVDSEVTDLTEVTGAYPIDIDSDGAADLAVLRRGEDVLLRGLGDCRFERANEALGFDGGDGWTVSFSAKWDPDASLPTLALGDYLTIVEYPEVPECAGVTLQRPLADGSGYGGREALEPGLCPLSLLFSDWDRSGRRDLRVTNDRQYYSPTDGEDQLWRIEPGLDPVAWTREEGWPKLQVWGMGLASEDLTGDGRPEVYVTSFADNKLQSLPDDATGPAYENIAGDLGVGIAQPAAGGEHLPSTSWHAEFDDVNNDGRVDLFVAKGNVEAMTENAIRDPSELLVAQVDGSFRRVAKAAGILDFERSRGAALTDLNLDGLLDLVEVKRAMPVRILRNVGAGSAAKPRAMGHWLAIELSQRGPNVDAIGSWIEVDRGEGSAVREVTIGGGHAGGELGPTHFGLGSAKQARVRVTWPDGAVSDWLEVDADARIRIERGSDQPIVLSDPAPAK
jgi:hypothetical protein